MKFKIPSSVIKSYWHAYIGIALTYASDYLFKFANSDKPKFHAAVFGWGLLGAVGAPATRALVAKWPFLSPLALRLTTKVAEEAKTPTPTV